MVIDKLLIVTIAYNPTSSIKDRILLSDYQFLVIDNSISQNSWLSQYCLEKNITYIANNANLGIAKALNIASRYAIDHGYDWIITMDQDSNITTEIIDAMSKFAIKCQNLDKVAILSPRHMLQYGRTVTIVDESMEYTEGLATMTSGNLLNLSIWQKICGFCEDLFIDMVDLEYYCKAMVNGYKIITLNHVYMQHSLGKLWIKRIFGKEVVIYNHNYIRKYYQVRNGLLIYRQYRKKVPGATRILRFVVGMTVGTLFEENRLQKFKFMFKGFIDFLRNKTGELDEK